MLLAPSGLHGALPVRTVVLATGDDVPGAGVVNSGVPAEAKFVSFSGYVDDGAGNSAYLGTWRSPSGRGTGLFHNGAPVAVVGGAAPTGSADDAKFATLGQPVLSTAGVAFGATLKGPKVHPRLVGLNSVWSNAEGTLKPVLTRLSAPPGLPDALIERVLSFSLQETELLALVELKVGRGGVNASSKTALIVSAPGRYQMLVQTGTLVTLQGSPGTVKKIGAFTPSPISPGQDRGHAVGICTAVLTLDEGRTVSVAIYSPTEIRTLVGNAPGTTYASFGQPATSGVSKVIFAAKKRHVGVIFDRNDEVILAGDPQFGLGTVVIEGETFTTGLKYGAFFDPIVNELGTYAFTGLLAGVDLSAANNRGIFHGSDSAAAALVARLDDLIPDAEGERRDDVHYATFLAMGLPSGGNAAPVWLARLRGTNVAARNNLALFARDSAGLSRRLLRNEDELAVGMEMKKVATFVALQGGNFPVGGRKTIGVAGKASALVTFTDGTMGLLRIAY